MSVYRVHKTKDYTVMSNVHLKDKRISLKAKGLISVMLSLSDEWQYSIQGLAGISKENETAIKTALDELKEFGYITVTKKMPNETQSGRIEYEYDIFETPREEKQGAEKQGVEIQGVEIQGVENQGQLNTKELNTKELNTKNKSNIYTPVIDYLNQKAGTDYRAGSKATQAHINARVAEGFTLEDFRKVIDNKVADWRGTEWEKFLRPQTLFGTKFESYLNEKPKSTQPKDTSLDEIF